MKNYSGSSRNLQREHKLLEIGILTALSLVPAAWTVRHYEGILYSLTNRIDIDPDLLFIFTTSAFISWALLIFLFLSLYRFLLKKFPFQKEKKKLGFLVIEISRGQIRMVTALVLIFWSFTGIFPVLFDSPFLYKGCGGDFNYHFQRLSNNAEICFEEFPAQNWVLDMKGQLQCRTPNGDYIIRSNPEECVASFAKYRNDPSQCDRIEKMSTEDEGEKRLMKTICLTRVSQQ